MDSGGRKSCRVRLMDPTCPLAVYENISEKLPKPFSLLDYRVRKLASAYEVEFDVRERIVFLLSGDLDVMAFYKGRKLAVLRREENSWTQLENLGVESVQHMICYDRKFYVVDKKGSTVSVDCKSLKVKKILESPRIVLGTGSKYLVESEENLYLLVEYCRCNNLPHKQKPINHPVVFDVFKLNEERNQWVPVMEGVDDRVFFLSSYCSYSLSADEFPGIKRNSVYFTGSSDTTYVKDPCHPGSVSVVFDIDKDKSRPLSYHASCYSKLFWPPPPWLNWSTSNSS